MRNMFKIKNLKSASLLLGLVVVGVMFAPDIAYADILTCLKDGKGSNIFETIACKVTTTLADVRKIIYVLAGFGLIAFAFAAIFNKISFKHLANIAFSLFLLSMLTPFIEYFTRNEGAEPLKYGSYLQPDFTESDYSTTFGECGDKCQASPDKDKGAGIGGIGGAGGAGGAGTVLGPDGMPLRKLEPINVGQIGLAGITAPKLDVDIKKLDFKSIQTTVKDTRTGWQKTKDTIKTVTKEAVKAYNTGNTIISGAKNVYKAVDMTVKAGGNISNISEAFTTAINAADNITTITSTVTGVASTIGTNYTNKEGEKTAGETVRDALAGVDNVANEGKDVAKDGAMVGGVVRGASEWGEDLKNW